MECKTQWYQNPTLFLVAEGLEIEEETDLEVHNKFFGRADKNHLDFFVDEFSKKYAPKIPNPNSIKVPGAPGTPGAPSTPQPEETQAEKRKREDEPNIPDKKRKLS